MKDTSSTSKKIKHLPILLVYLVMTASASTQTLNDYFSDTTINPTLWSTFLTSFGNSAIYESSGNVRFVNGSWLTTAAQFPNASVSGRFRISGLNYDRFKVLLRSDGTRTTSQIRIGGLGIQFTSSSNPDYGPSQTLQLWNYQTGAFLASAAPTITMNTYYDFLITDSGSVISVFLNNSPTAILSYSITTNYGNYIELGNREQAGGSGPPPYYVDLDYISIIGPVHDPSTNGSGSHYSIISGNFSWPAAKADAELRGGHLATLTDSNEVHLVETTFGQAILSKRLWLGATDQNVEGVWRWITDEPWTWGGSIWWTGNPSDSYGNEDFLEAQDFGNEGRLRFNDLGPIGYGDNQGYLLEKEGNSGNLPSSVVGTWEITVSGNDKGTAFITFSPDSTLSGYGISVNSFGLFTMAGTWSFDSKGRIVGSITEQLRGQSYLLNFIGTARKGIKLQVSAVGPNGSFRLKGIRAGSLPSPSGRYTGYVKQPGLSFTEVYDVTPASFPGVFNMSGYASEGFNISGALIISSRNVVNVYALSDFGAQGTLLSSLTGKTDPIKGTGKLKGVDINGGKFSVVTIKQ